MTEAYPILFAILVGAVVIWFFLCYRLFGILETRHPDKFDAMGRPSLIMNNSISNNIHFLKFLVNREWAGLGDAGLETLSKAMLVFFAAYLCLFGTLVASFLMNFVS